MRMAGQSKRLLVDSVRDLGPQFVNNPHRMVGQDGAYSIPLGGRRVLWYFGDTLIGDRPEESLWYIFGNPVGGQDLSGKGPFDQMITNTGLILRDRSGRQGLNDFSYILNPDGRLKQLVLPLPEEDPEKDRTWCMHGCKLNDKLYLFFMKILMLEEGGDPFPVGFKIIGTGLAVGSDTDFTFERIEHNGTTVLWPNNQPQFAASVLMSDESDWVYLYGSLQAPDFQYNAYIARVRSDDMERIDTYEYYCGDPECWSRDVYQARVIFSGMPNEMSVSYNAYLGQYLAVHSLGLSGKIVGRTAPSPWGPWSEAVELWTVETPETPLPYPRLVYAGKEHPELAEDQGRVLYITYVEFEEYFPHLIEVTLQ